MRAVLRSGFRSLLVTFHLPTMDELAPLLSTAVAIGMQSAQEGALTPEQSAALQEKRAKGNPLRAFEGAMTFANSIVDSVQTGALDANPDVESDWTVYEVPAGQIPEVLLFCQEVGGSLMRPTFRHL